MTGVTAAVRALLIILAIGSLTTAFGQQPLFDRANEKMEEYNVSGAFELYRSIESEGHRSGKLFYNMGLASLYRDSLGLAKYYFLRSEQYPETREEASEALHYLNSRFDRRSATLPKLPWERLFDRLRETLGSGGLMLLGLTLLNLSAASLIGSWFLPRGSAWFRGGAVTGGLAALLLIAASLYLQSSENRFGTGVMVENRTTVRERPETTASAVSTVYEGYTMRVDRKRSEPETGWHYVRLENGMYGWIGEETIRIF